MGVRIPSSPPDSSALVVEQSGTRLQPVINPVQLRASARTTHAEPVHLGVESSSHGECGEFNPLGSDQGRALRGPLPIWCSWSRHAPLVRERGGFESLGGLPLIRASCAARLRARTRPGSPKSGNGGSTPPGGTSACAHVVQRSGPRLFTPGRTVRFRPWVRPLRAARGTPTAAR
jgi:hypothetical protein